VQCVATLADGREEWVAQVTLRGPLSVDKFLLPVDSEQPATLPDQEQEKWQMLSLYTLPEYRGLGLGKGLCRAAFTFLEARPGSASAILVRIMVKPENQVTLGLYASIGFERTGTCTLEEALRANGDADLLPPEPLPERFTNRGGIIMALHLKRSTGLIY
jgi:ribosomal protein S18 acetylase RimI-like enzyme